MTTAPIHPNRLREIRIALARMPQHSTARIMLANLLAENDRLRGEVALLRRPPAGALDVRLTTYQRDMLLAIANGETCEDTAARMQLSLDAVKSCRLAVYAAFRVDKGRGGAPRAVALALAAGIIHPADLNVPGGES